MQLSGELDATYELQAELPPAAPLVVPGKSVMIGDSEDFDPCSQGLFNQLRGRTGAVRFVRVRVQIDQR